MRNPVNKTNQRFEDYLGKFRQRMNTGDFSAVKEVIKLHRLMEAADILQNSEDYIVYEKCLEYVDNFLSNNAQTCYSFSTN